MAAINDYVGKQFGDFRIGKKVGEGKEAEVFLCQHLTTGRNYILRLDVEDDAIWDEKPMIPPRNCSLEHGNCDGTWGLSQRSYPRMLERFNKGDSEYLIEYTPIYGVLDSRYLVPMASPVRVKNAWDINTVLDASPADDLRLFELWEELVLSMISGAYESSLPQKDWLCSWGDLIGGPILQSAMLNYLDGGNLYGEQKQRVLQNVLNSPIAGPEFAENALLRLIGCLSRHRMSFDQAQATLRCFYFRINITQHELHQIVAAYNALKSISFGAEDSIELIEFVLAELTKSPIDKYKNWECFEILTEQPDSSRFSLFLQESAGSSQSILQLEKS